MASPTPFPCTPYCVSVGSTVLFNLTLSPLSRDQTSNDEVYFEENLSQRDPLVLDGAVKDEEQQSLALPADLPDPTDTDLASLADTHQDTTFEEKNVHCHNSIDFIPLTSFH